MAVRVAQTISVCPERTPQTARCDAEHMSVQGNTSSYCSAHHIMINSLSSLVELARDSRREDSICKIVAVSIRVTSPSPHDQLKISISRMIPLYFSRRRVTDWIVFVCSWVTLTSDVTSCPGGDQRCGWENSLDSLSSSELITPATPFLQCTLVN